MSQHEGLKLKLQRTETELLRQLEDLKQEYWAKESEQSREIRRLTATLDDQQGHAGRVEAELRVQLQEVTLDFVAVVLMCFPEQERL